MEIIGIALMVAGTISCAYACVAYAKSSWYRNSDLMGATFAFDSFWIIGSILVATGLCFLGVVSWLVSVAISLGTVVIGKIFSWFLLEPLLHILFKNYRKQTSS